MLPWWTKISNKSQQRWKAKKRIKFLKCRGIINVLGAIKRRTGSLGWGPELEIYGVPSVALGVHGDGYGGGIEIGIAMLEVAGSGERSKGNEFDTP